MAEVLQIGELREYLAKDMVAMLGKVLDRMSNHDKIYWVLIHSAWDDGPKPSTPFTPRYIHKEVLKVKTENILRTNLIIMPVKPTHVLVGTICIEVDNKIGRAKVLWNLPMDAPRPAGIAQETGTENETIYESARRSRVIAHG